MARRKQNNAEKYIADVLSGKVVTGKLVRLAVERHMKDLEHGAERGLWFDEEAADRIVQFCGWCKHSKGEWAGQVFAPSPWQEFILRCIFGWKNSDGTRRFRVASIFVAKKNGKSFLASLVGVYLLVADNEPGAEVYSAATKRDQAKIVWDEAVRMVKSSPELSKRVRIFSGSLTIEKTNSSFKPLSSDTKTLDGPNIHGLILDELHAHKDRSMIETLEEGVGARRQPLQFEISTAGSDIKSIGYERYNYSEKVLAGIIEDDTWFAFLASLDKKDDLAKTTDDDWMDKRNWIKANPNLGISVMVDGMEGPFHRAVEVPARQNSFQRLRLNMWTEQADRWISVIAWDNNNVHVDENDLRGRQCYCGLDLASTTDLCAFAAVFPFRHTMSFMEASERHGMVMADDDHDDDEVTIVGYDLIQKFWLPRDNMRERVRRDRVPYDVWIAEGYIKATPGAGQDYDIIRNDIKAFALEYEIGELAIDRWNAHQISNQLMEDDIEVVTFGQGYFSMSAPSKEFERAIMARALNHGGNPVMRWMISNLAHESDAAENYKPSKKRSGDRIDGVVATIMGIGRAMVQVRGGDRLHAEGTIITL